MLKEQLFQRYPLLRLLYTVVIYGFAAVGYWALWGSYHMAVAKNWPAFVSLMQFRALLAAAYVALALNVVLAAVLVVRLWRARTQYIEQPEQQQEGRGWNEAEGKVLESGAVLTDFGDDPGRVWVNLVNMKGTPEKMYWRFYLNRYNRNEYRDDPRWDKIRSLCLSEMKKSYKVPAPPLP